VLWSALRPKPSGTGRAEVTMVRFARAFDLWRLSAAGSDTAACIFC
jgi:hypothetical protein